MPAGCGLTSVQTVNGPKFHSADRFGAAVAGTGGELQLVAQELQQHENQAVETVFLRAGQQVQLELVPRRWEGRGLLGCHLRPL